MKLRTPSPSMVVAIVALVFAMTGTGIAAVNYARNAGAVDGKSAVSASSLTSRAANKLVATQASGEDRGRIPAKFLADTAVTAQFGHNQAVPDNSSTAAIRLSDTEATAGLGELTMTCTDQNDRPGVLDPSSKVTFVNRRAIPLNAAWSVGNNAWQIRAVAPGTVAEFTINGSNAFRFHMQEPRSGKDRTVLIDGIVRQDGRNTGSAACLAYGLVTVSR